MPAPAGHPGTNRTQPQYIETAHRTVAACKQRIRLFFGQRYAAKWHARRYRRSLDSGEGRLEIWVTKLPRNPKRRAEVKLRRNDQFNSIYCTDFIYVFNSFQSLCQNYTNRANAWGTVADGIVQICNERRWSPSQIFCFKVAIALSPSDLSTLIHGNFRSRILFGHLHKLRPLPQPFK